LDREGWRDGRRQRQQLSAMFSGDSGDPVPGGRREGVEGLGHDDVALMATLVGFGEQPRRRRAR
jgi:hypothetical protein